MTENLIQQKGRRSEQPMESNALNAVMATESTEKRPQQSREALRTRRECPHCAIKMMYHTLLYKHVCRGSPAMKQKWLLERMDKRIRERVMPVSEAELESPHVTLECAQKVSANAAGLRAFSSATGDSAQCPNTATANAGTLK